MKLFVALCFLSVFYSVSGAFDRCKQGVTGLLYGQSPGVIIVFQGDHFWSYDFPKKGFGKVKLIHDYYPEVDIPISAVTEIPINGTIGIMFIKEKEYWKYRTAQIGALGATLVEEGEVAFPDKSYSKKIRGMQVGHLHTGGGNKVFLCEQNDGEGPQFSHCNINLNKKVAISKCSQAAEYAKTLANEACQGISRNNDLSEEEVESQEYIIAGTRTVLVAQDGEISRTYDVKKDIFKCPQYWLYIGFATAGILMVIITANIGFIIYYILRKKRQTYREDASTVATQDTVFKKQAKGVGRPKALILQPRQL